jgi:DNA-binding response OmpR family regulator
MRADTDADRRQRAGRVLVAEDDPAIRFLLETVLCDEGYEVAQSGDGKEALAVAATGWPDAVLLDLRMPALDGWGFLQAYRGLPGPHAPVVVLTAQRVTKTAAEFGAAAILRKPFEIAEVCAVLAAHVRPMVGAAPAPALA